MLDQIERIAAFILASLGHIWPYLLITIPLAVTVQVSGVSRHISHAFKKKPVTAIILATIVGAFSPFCSCGVIPVIAAMLIGGVPLAPVMSFWLASPSMDPEIFFLSASIIGWELALWRLGSTLFLSLISGFITHFIVERGWLGQQILRAQTAIPLKSIWRSLKDSGKKIKTRLETSAAKILTPTVSAQNNGNLCCISSGFSLQISRENVEPRPEQQLQNDKGITCGCPPRIFKQRLLNESWQATFMVAKFMILAFFLEAVIKFYIPPSLIIGLLGHKNPLSILTSALIGVPVYVNNLAALGMVGGLLSQGMTPAAALAFLIAGPTTTIPAMAAVWNLASRRVFALYVSFTLVGAVFFGYLYSAVSTVF